MEETKIHVLAEEGCRVWRGKCRSHPDAIEAALRRHASHAVKIGIETGPLTTWLWTELPQRGLPMVCLDARHAKRVLDMNVNKTDDNDAEGLAHIVRSGWYREVRVKSREAMLLKSLAGGQLLATATRLSNQIRGILKTFGLVVPKGKGGIFERNVEALLAGKDDVASIVLPLLRIWRTVREQTAARPGQVDRAGGDGRLARCPRPANPATVASRSCPSRSPSPAATSPTGCPTSARTRYQSARRDHRAVDDRLSDAADETEGEWKRATKERQKLNELPFTQK
jgi:transposase